MSQRRRACISLIAVLTVTVSLAGCQKATPAPSATAGGASSSTTAGPSGTPAASPSSAGVSATPSPAPTSSGDAAQQKALDNLEDDVTKDAKVKDSAEDDYTSYSRRARTDANFSFEAPTEWSDERRDAKPDLNLIAAPSVATYLKDYKTGVMVRRYTDQSADQILAAERSDSYKQCENGEIRPYDDGKLAGVVQTFTKCDGAGTGVVLAVVSKNDGGTFRGFFDTSFVDSRDVAALKRIVASLEYS